MEEATPALTDDFEGLKTSEEEVTKDVAGTARDPEFDVEPEKGLNCGKLMIKLEQMRSCF